MDHPQALNRLRAILEEARILAGAGDVLLRVAGERISVIAADVLYEIDFDVEDATSLLPPMRREPWQP